MNRRRWILTLLLTVSCGRAEMQAPPPPLTSTAPTWLSELKRVHAEVDRLIDRDQLKEARLVLSKAITLGAPEGVSSEQRRVVLADLWFRAAELDLRLGVAAEALTSAQQGLSLGRSEDVFTANLLITEGRAFEALKRDGEAAESYHRALVISETLLEKELSSDGEK